MATQSRRKTKTLPVMKSTKTISDNGLIAADEAMLQRRLAEVDAIHHGGAYLSAFERMKVATILRKLQLRLEPLSPSEIDVEAGALVAQYGPTLETAKRMMQRGRDPVDDAA
jgi:hypothetical protein